MCPSVYSSRVVEDEAQGVAAAGADRADAVADRSGGPATGAAHGPVSGGEDQAVTPRQRHAGTSRLGPRPLLDEEELTAGVVGSVLIKPDDDLEREDQVAEQVAVQGIPVPGLVTQQDLRALGRAGVVEHLEPLGQGVGPRGGPAELAGPA